LQTLTAQWVYVRGFVPCYEPVPELKQSRTLISLTSGHDRDVNLGLVLI